MLPFLPSPYPDELFYSICARFHQRSGHGNFGHTLRNLFGTRRATVTIDLPTNIRFVSENLPSTTCNSLGHLLEANTMLPYYRPFLPPKRINRVLNLISGNIICGNIHLLVGMIPSRIPSIPVLRYCISCLQADEQKYGEPYWHRCHQLAGIHLCHLHNTKLYNSIVPAYGIGCKNKLFPLSLEVLDGPSADLDPSEMAHHIWLATSAYWLLNSNTPLPMLDSEIIRQRYLHYLNRLGLANASGRLHIPKILSRFLNFYEKAFLDRMQCSFSAVASDNWLLSLLHAPKRTKSPLQHLLFIRFIGLELKDFLLNDPLPNQPFGHGPWPCLNPAAPHFQQWIIDNCTITRRPRTGEIVGTFYCECGFSYERTGPDKSFDDRFRIGRVMTFGPAWEERLLKLKLVEGNSLRETARKLKVDPKTVQKHLDKHTNRLVKLRPYLYFQEEITLNSKRDRWLRLCADHPNIGVKALRQLDQADYTWLFRHDKTWLQTHLPHHKQKSSSVAKVNWDERDNVMASKIQAVVEQIKAQEGKPVRITMGIIGRRLAATTIFEKKLDRLPRTKSIINSVVESKDDFAIRRLRFIANVLNNQGDPIRVWKLMKMAGLTPACSERVFNEVKSFSEGYLANSKPSIEREA